MGYPAEFYQTFYQYDTLFKVTDTVAKSQVPQLESPVVDPPAEQQQPEVLMTPKIEPPTVVLAPVVPLPKPRSIPEVKVFPALQHRILVLVDEPRQPELLPAEAQLLDKILAATGHASAETDLLNFSYIPKADARSVLAEKSTNYFITFGVPLIRLQIDLLLPPYTPKQVEGIWFLLADPLATIEADKMLKKRLWQALQKMFGLA
ncbi:hypothetical protein [Arundinibacter roseus]|uniref:Uncharacterized protein n=1 Tax=Arundinibacter roseus TaxID=2070510 RepID=A0A4R4JYA3_9BACT|nr:hypothetical protein [Arundinibacter roseus]TDB59814.1 hypothetical protein EZE20_21910 [Arundinibacter roseus]